MSCSYVKQLLWHSIQTIDWTRGHVDPHVDSCTHKIVDSWSEIFEFYYKNEKKALKN